MPASDHPYPCPVCHGPLLRPFEMNHRDVRRLTCANCGDHQITDDAFYWLRRLSNNDAKWALIAHAVAKLKAGGTITEDFLDSVIKATKLPDALECIENLLLILAQLRPGERILLPAVELQARIGTVTDEEAQWVIEQALQAALIIGSAPAAAPPHGWAMKGATLTAAGWQQVRELQRKGLRSTHAFMAMDFNQADIRHFFGQHLQTAVAHTGFELRTTDHPGKTAGLIDNRMRVDLRTSRFVVCDLTHGNRGAYWEAGFAEGIGRPVFYICRRDVLDNTDKDTRPHFDAAHQAIVAWDPADPAPGLAELKAMIRATLPAEARMEDPAGDAGARPGQP